MLNINEVGCEKIRHQKETGKIQPVIILLKNGFSKFIGCIILVVTYKNKRYMIWVITHRNDLVNMEGKIDSYVFGKTYTLKVSCHI